MKKKMIIIAVAAASLLLYGWRKLEDANKTTDSASSYHGLSCYIRVIEIEGHKYILMDGTHSSAIVHAASCHCMEEKKKLP